MLFDFSSSFNAIGPELLWDRLEALWSGPTSHMRDDGFIYQLVSVIVCPTRSSSLAQMPFVYKALQKTKLTITLLRGYNSFNEVNLIKGLTFHVKSKQTNAHISYLSFQYLSSCPQLY